MGKLGDTITGPLHDHLADGQDCICPPPSGGGGFVYLQEANAALAARDLRPHTLVSWTVPGGKIEDGMRLYLLTFISFDPIDPPHPGTLNLAGSVNGVNPGTDFNLYPTVNIPGQTEYQFAFFRDGNDLYSIDYGNQYGPRFAGALSRWATGVIGTGNFYDCGVADFSLPITFEFVATWQPAGSNPTATNTVTLVAPALMAWRNSAW